MLMFGEAFGVLSVLFEQHGLNDWLGKLYMDSYTSSNKNGQFFTPFHLSLLTAETTAAGVEDMIRSGIGVVSVEEPSCGSGGMVLALAESLRK